MKILLNAFVVLSIFRLLGDSACSSTEKSSQTTYSEEQNVDLRQSSDKGSRDECENSSAPIRQLEIERADCMYKLNNQAGNNYHPRNMIDGNSATTWAAKLSQISDDYSNGIIVGPKFYLETPSKIDGVEIQNGYCKNSSSFTNNTRASWITIYRYHPEYDGEFAEDQAMGYIEPDDVIYDGPLRDNMDFQYLSVRDEFDNRHKTEVVGLLFHRGKFYPGKKWVDLCLSEIRIYGR